MLYLYLFALIGTAFAQQNFFNIPSGQMTPDREIFYQHQVNAFRPDSLASKQHLVFGVSNRSEVGVNFVNFYPLKYSDKEGGSSRNIFAPTYQYQHPLTDTFSLNLGGQYGISHIGTSGPTAGTGKGFAVVTWFDPSSHLRFTAGPWISDRRFNGAGVREGIMAGGEWMFTEGWYLMGDWVSGNTKNSVAVIGGMVDVRRGVQLCLGALVPNRDSSEGQGLVFELNAFTF